MFVIFFISALAETNRPPFDLPEAESELVAGYPRRIFGSMTFALFFLGEYANMILMRAMTAILFLGGWLPPFAVRALHLDARRRSGSSLKIAFVLFFFIWVARRAALPLRPADAAGLEGVPAVLAAAGWC